MAAPWGLLPSHGYGQGHHKKKNVLLIGIKEVVNTVFEILIIAINLPGPTKKPSQLFNRKQYLNGDRLSMTIDA